VLRRHLRLCQDYLADARAAEQAPEAEDYAEYLVTLSRRRLAAPAAALGIVDRGSNLYRRILMLLQTRTALERRCLKAWTAAAALGGLALLGLCAAVRLDAADAPAAKKAPEAKKADKAPAAAKALHYTGQVFDKATRKPLAGATITVRRSLLGDPEQKEYNRVLQETKHVTDAQGKYRFTIPPEQTAQKYLYIELDAEHPDYAPQRHFGYALGMILKNEKIGGRPFFEDVRLWPGKAVRGTLRTPEGTPASGVKVLSYSVISRANKGPSFEYGSFNECLTDKAGTFRLVVVTPGAAVFWILPEKYSPSVHRVKEGKRGDLGTFTLEQGAVLRGKVVDVRGKPLAGVNVNAEREGRGEELQDLPVADAINRSAVSDAKGEFTMNPLPPGTYRVLPNEHARDNTKPRGKKYAVPAVFLPTKVTLKDNMAKAFVEVRAVPHVEIVTQYYDSKGKPTRGHSWHVFGRVDKSFWFGQAKMDASGKGILLVPHGLEDVRLSLMTNEHGALRYRMGKGQPLTYGRDIKLGTLNEDVRGIEIVRYVAPIVLIKVRAADGKKLTGVKMAGIYKSGKSEKVFPVGGVPTNVFFEKQEDGRFRTFSLLPDEDVTFTAHQPEGYRPASVTLRLPEGGTRDVELVLQPAAKK
jgi:protocatechuate 3,4-dioxygenase beta subunit